MSEIGPLDGSRHDSGTAMRFPHLSYRQRVLLMLALLIVFMAGIALSNTVSEPLGIAVCAVAFIISAAVVFGDRRRG